MNPYSPLLLGHLAPYLPLNLLFDLVARYPRIGLLEEILDPNGRIWTERTLIELEEPPLILGENGTRAYHLYTSSLLAPWGTIQLGWNRVNPIRTKVRAKWVWGSTRRGEDFWRLDLFAWLPQGLAIFQKVVEDPDEELLEKKMVKALEDPKSWRVFARGPFRFISAREEFCQALLENGELYSFHFDDEGNLLHKVRLSKDLRLRKMFIDEAYTMTIDLKGNRRVYPVIGRGDPLTFEFVKNPPELSLIIDDRFVRLSYDPSDPSEYLSGEDYTVMTIKKYPEDKVIYPLKDLLYSYPTPKYDLRSKNSLYYVKPNGDVYHAGTLKKDPIEGRLWEMSYE